MPTDATTRSDTGRHVRAAFDVLIELAPSERADWLAANITDPAERAAIERLLAADDADGYLDTPAASHARDLGAEDLVPEGLLGQRIGDFRILRAIGRGGMASIFLAERVGRDFRQQVAIKLLRRGLYSELEQRLFLRERQVLAALDHPSIARLIDGGVTAAGIPYLVMEYVDGVPITTYATAQRLATSERVRLFLRVCRAVEAAHRNLVVHRDIKPSNILVTATGEVKLLDFGIAKLIEEDTPATHTAGVFTPEYAAPEQLRGGAITTATDVHGLGVLLHELLLGLRPAGSPTRRPSSRANEVPVATDPARTLTPARLRKALRGDLDNILMKALEEEPTRRYASADALADDIERYLDGRTVAAHPPSRLYRTRKFVQRHRGGVAVTALFLLGILAALGLALWQADVARREAVRANTVRDFVVGLFDAARAHLPRDQRPTPEILVEQAQRQLVATPLDDGTRADVLRMLAEVSLSMANFARAQSLAGDALAAAARGGDMPAADAARALQIDALQRAGRNADALREGRAQIAGKPAPSPAILRTRGAVAAAEMALGDPAAALADRRQATADAARLYGPDSAEAIAIEFELGNALANAQRYPEAVSTLQPALARWRAGHSPQDDRYVAALSSLATATDGIGDAPATEARYRELLDLDRRIYTAPHGEIARTMRDLGQVIARSGKYAEAQSLLEQALAMERQVYGGSHREIAETEVALGEIAIEQRRFDDGDARYRAAIATCERAGIRDEVCPRARNNLGQSFYRQGRLDEAKEQMTQALAERRVLFGNDHPTVAFSLSTLANVAAKQKDYAQAVRLSAEALGVLDRDGRAASREAVLVRNGYAQALWLAGRNDEALAQIERTLAEWQRVSPQAKARRVMMLVQKAQILRDLKRADDARGAAEEAIALRVDASLLAPATRDLLRQLSGRSDVYPEPAPATTP
jgi:eukaryotic-like serine/threonine-protein kinase